MQTEELNRWEERKRYQPRASTVSISVCIFTDLSLAQLWVPAYSLTLSTYVYICKCIYNVCIHSYICIFWECINISWFIWDHINWNMIHLMLGWLKISFRFFCKMFWKNPNEPLTNPIFWEIFQFKWLKTCHFEGILTTSSTKPSVGREDRAGTSVSLFNLRTSLEKKYIELFLWVLKKKRHHLYNIWGNVTLS